MVGGEATARHSHAHFAPRSAGAQLIVFPVITKCHFCQEPATFREFCEDCYEERIEAYIAPQELMIEFPCSRIHNGVLHVLRTQLKSR